MTEQPATRISLILRVANDQDIQAWEQFADIYQPLVFRIARSRGLQEADANDLVQEVMTRVARSVANWDPDSTRGSFRGWISRIARNLIIDFLRNKNRLPKTSDQTEVRRLIETKPDESAESSLYDLEFEKQIFIWAADRVQKQFKEPTWQAFWRTAVLNEPVEVVASELKMTSGAVYIARSRVMSKLKEIVQTQSEIRD